MIDQLIKIVHYTPMNIMIDILNLVELIINIIICYYKVLELIIMD